MARLRALLSLQWLEQWRGTQPRLYYSSAPIALKVRRGVNVNQRTVPLNVIIPLKSSMAPMPCCRTPLR